MAAWFCAMLAYERNSHLALICEFEPFILLKVLGIYVVVVGVYRHLYTVYNGKIIKDGMFRNSGTVVNIVSERWGRMFYGRCLKSGPLCGHADFPEFLIGNKGIYNTTFDL